MRTLLSFVVAIPLAFAPVIAHAQNSDSDATHQNARVLPYLQNDVGLGAGSSSFGQTTLTYSAYKVLGSQLGLSRGPSVLFSSAFHYYPFSFREVGMLATIETLLLNGDGGAHQTPTGALGTSDSPSYYSVEIGPEAQMRFGPVLARAAPLVGWRDLSYGHYDAVDVRIGGRVQVDYLFGGAPNSSGMTLAAFAGMDALPTFGWTAGVSFSYALF